MPEARDVDQAVAAAGHDNGPATGCARTIGGAP